MNTGSKYRTTAAVIFILVALLFVLVLLYMFLFEEIDIYQARNTDSYSVVQDYSVQDIEDKDAPAGIRRVYSWELDDMGYEACSLTFYLVHHYAEVYFDDELMYSLAPDENNRITYGVSSNWITVPILREDIGKEVRVVVTPVYKNVTNRSVQFMIGSCTSVFFHQMKADLVQIILSSLCILLGLVMMIHQLSRIVKKASDERGMLYLGMFSLLLGLWRITDTRFSPLLFSSNTLALGYISIGMLCIGTIPLLLYVDKRFAIKHERSPFTLVAIASSAVAFVVLLCQITGIAEFKQTLILCHLLIMVDVLTLLISFLLQKHFKTVPRTKALLPFLLLLIGGALLDLILFGIKKSSSGLIFTIMAFLIYAASLFFRNIMDIQKQAYTDAATGLFNRSRWNNLMKDKTSVNEPIGIIFIDLNRLKYVNDTMGHDMGDKLIFNFSNILRNTIPPSNTICRWGGDEFAILITGANKEKMEKYLSTLEAEVLSFNHSGEKPEIHYAAGYALSTEYPGLCREELFKLADEKMYLDKQKWYTENLNVTR